MTVTTSTGTRRRADDTSVSGALLGVMWLVSAVAIVTAAPIVNLAGCVNTPTVSALFVRTRQ